MQKIHFWRGYHSRDFTHLLQHCWTANELLVCFPPKLNDNSPARVFPKDKIEWHGNFTSRFPAGAASAPELSIHKPILGIFTSGTTRNSSKLVLYSKENILSAQEAIFSLFDQHRISEIFCYPQPYHVFGLLLGYVASLTRDLRLTTPLGIYSKDSHRLRLLSKEKNLLTLGTPTHFRDLASYCRETKLPPQNSYSCIIGGAKVLNSDWSLAQEQLKIEAPSIGYGCTEASPGVTHLAPGQAPDSDGDIGNLLRGLKLLNHSDQGYDLIGSNVCLATVENGFVSTSPRLRVSDQIRRKADGSFQFLGRTANWLNRGGEKFSLDRIEEFLHNKFNLRTICVALKDERLGEELGILAQERQPTLDTRAVFRSLKEEFGRSFSPNNFRSTPALPINEQAKTDRKGAQKFFP